MRDDAENGDLGYPASGELEPGKIITVYYQPVRGATRFKKEGGLMACYDMAQMQQARITQLRAEAEAKLKAELDND